MDLYEPVNLFQAWNMFYWIIRSHNESVRKMLILRFLEIYYQNLQMF